mgnify:CR=1 FL=1
MGIVLALGLGVGGGAGEAGAAAPGAEAKASATKTVRIPGFSFRPARLTIARGDRVVFRNRDSVAHTATRAGAFDTKRIAPGATKAVRFRQRGTFPYLCKLHPFMRGTIVVR